MSIPAWADPKVSEPIAAWCSHEEGQHLEFTAEFSENTTELAREVAAFASSGGGAILLGVTDDGKVRGLPSGNKERDKLYHRVQGVVKNAVRPSVRANIAMAHHRKRFVLVIDVSDKQDEPVYYVEYRPYVRDGRTSRPADPDEVKAKIWAHGSSESRRRFEELQAQSMQHHADHMRRLDEQAIEDQRQWSAVYRKLLGGN